MAAHGLGGDDAVPRVGAFSVEALSDLSDPEVAAALHHYRHWLTHTYGGRARPTLESLEEGRADLSALIDSAGWDHGVLVHVAGTFFDTNVACDQAPAPPMAKLRAGTSWAVAFTQHRGAVGPPPEGHADVLRLACFYGGAVALTELDSDGEPARGLGVWRVNLVIA